MITQNKVTATIDYICKHEDVDIVMQKLIGSTHPRFDFMKCRGLSVPEHIEEPTFMAGSVISYLPKLKFTATFVEV